MHCLGNDAYHHQFDREDFQFGFEIATARHSIAGSKQADRNDRYLG